jgi:hypothetical protein
LSVTGFAGQYIRHKKIVMSLPIIPVGSITLAGRQAVIASLQQLLGDRLSTAASIRERHGKDAPSSEGTKLLTVLRFPFSGAAPL